MGESSDTATWPVGMWSHAQKRGHADWETYVAATPIETVLLDIEESFVDAVAKTDSDWVKGQLRKSRDYSAFLVARHHGAPEAPLGPRHLESFELDGADLIKILLGWAIGRRLDEVVAIIKAWTEESPDEESAQTARSLGIMASWRRGQANIPAVRKAVEEGRVSEVLFDTPPGLPVDWGYVEATALLLTISLNNPQTEEEIYEVASRALPEVSKRCAAEIARICIEWAARLNERHGSPSS